MHKLFGRRIISLTRSFNDGLLRHCFCCKEICHIENPDEKHPDRWNKGTLCRTVDRGKGKKSYLWVVLEVIIPIDDILLY